MPNQTQSSMTDKKQSPTIERPLTRGFAPYALTSEQIVMLPLMPVHQYQLHADIFGNPRVMQYVTTGKHYTLNEYAPLHLVHVKQNQTPQFHPITGHLSRFTWSIITKDGIAGRINILPTEERTELAFCISPLQQKRSLARLASELVIAYLGEETSFIATAHPKNIGSYKSIEHIHYPDRTFVFFRDASRQNYSNKYGEDQPRDYFISHPQNTFSFFSFVKQQTVIVDIDQTSQQKEKSRTTAYSR